MVAWTALSPYGISVEGQRNGEETLGNREMLDGIIIEMLR